jgi:hypothetical protein
MRKALTTLAALAGFAGVAIGGPATLPGLAGSAQAQAANTWTFTGSAPIQPGHNVTNQNWGNNSGRITSVASPGAEPSEVLVGSAGGGVWKSQDTGGTWNNLLTTDNVTNPPSMGSSLAIGSLWTSNDGVTIYAGTGELNGGDSQYGQGVLKSVDGGGEWEVLGAGTFNNHFIGGIAANRDDPSQVFAATDQGLFSSSGRDVTWRQVTALTDKIPRRNALIPVSGQVYEIHQDPITPAKWWASFGDNCRTENGGIATSDDNGATWNVPFSSRDAARIGLGVGPGPGGVTDSTLAYAAVAACARPGVSLGALASIQKSDNGGANWAQIPTNTPGYEDYFKGRSKAQDANAQGYYDNTVAVDPTDGNRAVFGGITILATADGGAGFTDVGRVFSGGPVHPDIHAFAFTDASTFYVGEDGGVWHTPDLGGSWQNLNGGTSPLAITQFNAGTSPSATKLLGGTQDNGSPGAGVGFNTTLPTMHDITSGDGGATAIDPNGALYTTYPNLGMVRWTGTPPRTQTNISPCAARTPGNCVRGANRDPVAFYAPYVMAPLDLTFTGNTTNGSTTVTNVSSTAGLTAGETVSGSGIPANTAIVAVDSATSAITLSNPATTPGTGTTFTAGSGRLLAGTNKVYQTVNARSGTPRTFRDGATAADSNVVTSTNQAQFTPADVGKSISGSPPPGTIPAGAVITSWISATSVTISANATGPGSELTLDIRAAAWTPFSPRLTKTDFGTLSSISPLSSVAPTANKTIFTTSNDGEVARTNDNGGPNGTGWKDITGNLPTTATTTNPAATNAKPLFTSVTFNPTNAREAWVTVGALGNARPVGIWHTTNAGAATGTTWKDLAEGTDLPNAPVLSVVQSPTNADTIYIGTYYGVWQCTTCGGTAPAPSWERLGTNLPNAEVDQLTLTSDQKTLVAWTHGRGVWMLPLS